MHIKKILPHGAWSQMFCAVSLASFMTFGGWLLLLAVQAQTAAPLAEESAMRRHTVQKLRYLTNIALFEADRQLLMSNHLQTRFCSDITLTPAEQKVNRLLTNHVAAYYDKYRTEGVSGPAKPFYEAKKEIQESAAFHLLKTMPKGALLHAHLTAVGRMDWIINSALTLSNCYVKWPDDPRDRGNLKLLTPEAAAQELNYVAVSTKVAEFDARGDSFAEALRTALTLGADDVETGSRVWAEFGKLFGRTGEFIRYRQVFTNYLLDAFQTLWDDGVYYVELRDSIGQLRDVGGTNPGNHQEFIEQFLAARTMMRAKHREFDCRLIIAGGRRSSAAEIVTNLNRTLRWAERHYVIGGFDLIGEEVGKPDDTTYAKVADVQRTVTNDVEYAGLVEKMRDKDFPYYLHDGESAWADNENLLDAVLLTTPRIGHAFNLYRFPTLYPLIKAKDIALEICPISNQLLGLSPDLRTHPAAGYMNAGIQCVLASDDPMFFGNDGLSYDFWEALMAWNLDLAALKKLAQNSITYSGLDEPAKRNLLGYWTTQWNQFIATTVSNMDNKAQQ